MSRYIAESVASKIRAENVSISGMLNDIEDYLSHPDYKDRIGTEELNAEGVAEEMAQWMTNKDNLGLMFLDAGATTAGSVKVIIEPTLMAEYINAIEKRKWEATPFGKVYQTHDMRVRNRIILVLEINGELGKGYIVLKAWNNVRSIREAKFFTGGLAVNL